MINLKGDAKMEIANRVKRDTTTVRSTNSTRVTKALLACGVVSAPLFYIVAVGQILTRPGFDIRRHAISTLSLGNLGWIQITNFAVTGVLAIACAIGVRQALRGSRAGTWGPILIGIYGAGLITGAIFHPDPGLGFPPGAPAAMPTSLSPHATVHMVGFSVAFVAVTAACFVFRRRFANLGYQNWAKYCVATGVVTPILIVLGSSIKDVVGVIFAIAGVVAFGWVAAVAARLRTELSGS
jgi:hypothetical protein